MLRAILLAGALSAPLLARPQAPHEVADDLPGLHIDRGPDRLGLVIPDSEELVFDVLLDVAVLGETRVGKFTLAAGTEPYTEGLPIGREPTAGAGGTIGWIRARVDGGYLGYRLDHEIAARHLPKAWPAVIYRSTQRGTENRRRELMYGLRDGESTGWYRSDRHCKGCERREHFVESSLFANEGHCKKCKRGEHRVWKKPHTFELREGAVDMLTAIFLARTLLREELRSASFPLVDRDDHWLVTLARGGRRRIEVPAGDFVCRSISLDPKTPDGEDNQSKFSGLFGIHGTIDIWLDERTGVPVEIAGTVPVGPFSIDVALRLKEFRGTPDDFAAAK